MKSKPLRVELIGLLPALYRVCTTCQPVDYLSLSGVDYIAEQLAGYPPDVVEEQKKLYELYDRLGKDFGESVATVPVTLMSLRGLWLSLRHNLKRGPAVIIHGQRIVREDLSYDAIKEIVKEELAQA